MENIRFNEDRSKVVIIDQTALPNERVLLELGQKEECFDAIRTLKVRGAPAIGIFAAYAMAALSRQWADLSYPEFLQQYKETSDYLNSARPTAVNLSWALRRMMKAADNDNVSESKAGGDPSLEEKPKDPISGEKPKGPALGEKPKDPSSGEKPKEQSEKEPCVREIIELLGNEAEVIRQEDIDMCAKIAAYGLSLLKDGEGILTHCNAGPLATSKYGTALGPILLGKKQGMNFKVYADETRPLLQGARLTAYELQEAGVDVTLICDNMASAVMKNGWIDKVFVGCDRVAANGDFANKIGTSGLAILAKHYGIPFYVLGPSSTIDLDTVSGKDIPVELRDPDEIRTMWYEKPMAPEDVKCYNPSFDVTDHSLLTGIITEKGIVYPPFDVNLRKLFS